MLNNDDNMLMSDIKKNLNHGEKSSSENVEVIPLLNEKVSTLLPRIRRYSGPFK